MPSIADMQREDRLQGLWDALMKQLPKGTNQRAFSDRDPMAADEALRGGYGRQADPYMALRFLQLGQALQGGGGQGNDMIGQLIQAYLSQMQGKR